MKEPNWNLGGSFHGHTALEVSAVRYIHLATAVAEAAGVGSFPEEGERVLLRGFYLAEGKAQISGEGRRYASDPDSIGWSIKWNSNYKRLECRRSDWTEDDGKERWVLLYPAPGARIRLSRSIYGNDPGGYAGAQGEWIFAGGAMIPAPWGGRYASKSALREARKRIKEAIREQEAPTILMLADILGVSVD